MPKEQYLFLYKIFNHYNEELFSDQLPAPLFTIAKLPNVASGVFLSKKWASYANAEVHQISFNPEFFTNKNILELHQVIVHEMVHLWQQEFGKPSRNGYHNKEWAKKMLEIGLVPTNTGTEGGKTTGQKVGDYPKPGGNFLKAFEAVKNIKIPFEYNS